MATAPASTRLLPLRANAQVALVVESFPALIATVVATTKTQATLVLSRDTVVPARMLHRRPAALEAVAGGRRFRGEGEVAMVTGRRGRVRDDAVVFHFSDGTPKLRRVHPRAPAILPVTVVPVRAALPPANAQTVDLSAGGVLLHLTLPGEDLPVPAAGEVVRRTPEGDLGVRLDRMRPADRDLVIRWIRGRAGEAPTG